MSGIACYNLQVEGKDKGMDVPAPPSAGEGFYALTAWQEFCVARPRFCALEGCLFLQGECWSLFWRTSCRYGLVCSYPYWPPVSPAFMSGCSLGSVGIQASVFPVDPLFCSVTLVFLTQLPMVSLIQLFPP